MTAVKLLPPGTGPHEERWHELRRAGVTASEIAVVMGISPYDSPFNLYWSKLNDWRWGGNEYTGVGTHLEDAIAEWWAAENAALLGDPPLMRAGLYAHPERPWQLATPDRKIRFTVAGRMVRHGLLECKWVAQSWDGWGEPGTDDIPTYYRAQGLWQADVLGVDEVHFAVLGPTGFRAYLVRRDERGEADLQLMRAAGEDFVRRLAEGDVPDLDSHTATLSALKKLHPSVEDGEVEVPVDLAEAYRVARAEKKAAEERVDLLDNRLRDLLAGRRKAVCKGRLVASRSVYERKPYSVGPTTIDKLNPGRADSYVA
jgi:putative phage-type endonuclease